MSGRIKGITVEIGGETTGLQKALKDVNKESMDLTKELKDVDRLLKFNPSNVEALAQKQELLARQVAATTNKLDQLKEAEKQVQAQFEKGDISEEQYRAFRREIEFTQGSLDGLKGKLSSMIQEQSKVEASTRELNEMFDTTKTSVDDFSDVLGTRLTAAIRNGAATSAQLSQAIEKIEKSMNDAALEEEKLALATRELKTLFDAAEKEIDDFTDVLGTELTAAIREGTATCDQLELAIDKIGKAALGADADLERFKKALKSIHNGSDLDQIKKELDDIANEAKEAEQAVEDFGSQLEAVAGTLVAGGGIAGAIQQALDTTNLDTKIDISMEVPSESVASVKNAVKEVETYGIDAESALEGVRKQWALNKGATDEANTAVIKGASAIAASYAGIDFSELIQEINEIASELKISDENALGLVNSLLKVGFPPDQLDIIAEYGGQLQRAGYDAEEIQAIMAAGIDTGTWNIDNLLDGLKEGRIRMAEFGAAIPKALSETVAGTKISTDQLMEWGKAVAEGGEKGSKAMVEVAKALMNVEDATKRNEIATEIFGTMYEDQGDKILETLINAENSTVSLKQNQEDLNESVKKLDESPAVKMQQAMVDLKKAFEPVLAVIADVVSAIAEWASENPKLAASITGISIAIGIVVGAIALLAPGFVALSGAIAGAGGAAAVFGGAIALLTGPIGIGIAALAGLVAGGVALNNHMKQSSIEVDIFGNKVSESTQKAVGGFLELNENATVALNQLAWSGQTVTSEMANGIVNTFSQMGDQVLTAMQEDHAAQLATMQTFFDTSAALTDAEEAEILAKMQANQQTQQQTIADGQARIAEILNTAKEQKRGITEAERNEINGIQEQMKLTAIEHMSENEREQKVILERLKSESSKITAEQAAEVVKNSLKQKNDVVKEANDQYDKVVAEIIKQRDETGTMSAEQAQKAIDEAKKQRDETVRNAEEQHKKVVTEAKNQATEHAGHVDWETGEVLSKWDKFKKDFDTSLGLIKKVAVAKWDEMSKDAQEKWDEIKKWPGKKIDEMKKSIDEKMRDVKKEVQEGWQEAENFLKEIDLIDIGKDIVSGLAKGISNSVGKVKKAVESLASHIPQWAKDILGIFSPSRVMRDEVGYHVGTGMAAGIKMSETTVERSMEQLGATTLDAAKKWIEEAKYYGRISLNEELAILEKTLTAYAYGTKERQELEREIYRVKKEMTVKKEQIDNDYLNKVKSLNQKLIDEENRLNDAYKKAIDDRAKTLTSFAGIFDAIVKKDISGDQLLENLNSQVDAFKDWQENITELASKGINEGLLAELRAMGPRAGAEIEALNSLTEEQLEEYVKLWEEKNRLAKEQATKELEDMKWETLDKIDQLKFETAEKLNEYQDEWRKAMVDAKLEVRHEASEMPAIGQYAVSQLIQGMLDKQDELIATAEKLATAVQDTFRSALDFSVDMPEVDASLNSDMNNSIQETAARIEVELGNAYSTLARAEQVSRAPSHTSNPSSVSETTVNHHNYYMTVNSPKALDPYETSRLSRNMLREMALKV